MMYGVQVQRATPVAPRGPVRCRTSGGVLAGTP